MRLFVVAVMFSLFSCVFNVCMSVCVCVGGDAEPPSTLLWALALLAQHQDRVGQHQLALTVRACVLCAVCYLFVCFVICDVFSRLCLCDIIPTVFMSVCLSDH